MKSIGRGIIVVAMLAGCGSSSSSEPFAGCWRGTSTVQMASGEPVPAWIENELAYPTAEVCIGTGTATSVGYLCSAGLGPQAMVTSPSSFTVSSYTCPPGGVSRDVGVAIGGGNATLSRGSLTLSVDYVLTYGGQDYPVTFVLDAIRTCTPSDCPPSTGG